MFPNSNKDYNNQIQSLNNYFLQMQPGINNLYNINFKNYSNMLLNKIKSSIMTEYHSHPLYSCLTPQRAQFNKFWTCKSCRCNYNFNIPSYYCTACDYDLCQKCLLQSQLFKIQLYDYSKRENFNVGANPNHNNYKQHIHKHIMVLILIENYNPNEQYVLHCRGCRCDIRNNEYFYYCSLCNYYVCQNCFNTQPNQFQNNQFSPQQQQQQNFFQNNNQNQFFGNNINPNNNPNLNQRFNNNNQMGNSNNQGFINNQMNQIPNNFQMNQMPNNNQMNQMPNNFQMNQMPNNNQMNQMPNNNQMNQMPNNPMNQMPNNPMNQMPNNNINNNNPISNNSDSNPNSNPNSNPFKNGMNYNPIPQQQINSQRTNNTNWRMKR